MCLSLKSLFLIAFVYLQVRFYFVRAEKNLGLIPSYKISVLGSYLKKESQCFFWFFFRGFFDIFLTTVVFLLFELVIRYSGIQVHPGSTFQDSDLSYSAVQEGLRKPWSGFLLLAVLLGKKNMDLTYDHVKNPDLQTPVGKTRSKTSLCLQLSAVGLSGKNNCFAPRICFFV